MSQIRRHFPFTFHTLMLLMLYVGHASGQTSVDHLLKQRMTVSISEVPFITIVATLSAEHRVPIGLELGTVSYDWNRHSIDVSNETLARILDRICQLWPLYRWEVTDGVINFVPATARDLLLEQLLATKISYFSPGKGIDRFELRDAIFDLPEVKSFLNVNQVSVFRLAHPSRGSDGVGTMDLSVSSTNVKGVLNKIIRESERRFWVVSRRLEDGKVIQMGL